MRGVLTEWHLRTRWKSRKFVRQIAWQKYRDDMGPFWNVDTQGYLASEDQGEMKAAIEKHERMEKADTKTVVDLCVSLDPTITALCSLVDKIPDPELQKEYRDTVGMLMFHSALIIFMMKKTVY